MLRILIALALLCSPAQAGTLSTLGAGSSGKTAAAGAYTGPGDVQSGWVAFWGLNAFTAALRGNKLIRVCDNTGANCDDILSDASTGMPVPKVLVGGTACPGANCLVTKMYDQTVGLNCSGASCDVIQSTAANMPKFLANQFGTNPGVVWTAANNNDMRPAIGNLSISVPYGNACVLQTTTITGSAVMMATDDGSFTDPYFYRVSGAFTERYPGTSSTISSAAISINTSYAVALSAGAGAGATTLNVNGATTTATFTGTSAHPAVFVGTDAFTENWDGLMGACGWLNAVTPNASNIVSNLRTIWGF